MRDPACIPSMAHRALREHFEHRLRGALVGEADSRTFARELLPYFAGVESPMAKLTVALLRAVVRANLPATAIAFAVLKEAVCSLPYEAESLVRPGSRRQP